MSTFRRDTNRLILTSLLTTSTRAALCLQEPALPRLETAELSSCLYTHVVLSVRTVCCRPRVPLVRVFDQLSRFVCPGLGLRASPVLSALWVLGRETLAPLDSPSRYMRVS